MNKRALLAVAGVAGVVYFLSRRYTSDPFASFLSLAPGEPAPATPSFTSLVAVKEPKDSAPLGAMPTNTVAAEVPDLAPPEVWPSEPLPPMPWDVEKAPKATLL